ncbi:MAG: Cyclase/dehydrase [Bryobacterales bacterium]|jgi:uncharacterized membrane protein|nr:Cyclase/dehydrase [Bryobacterales bacterium]
MRGNLQHNSGSHRMANRDFYERLSGGLGWFSIALGVAEVAAPSRVAALIGVRDEIKTRKVLRTYGLREIASGVGILSEPRPARWVWGRVGGDLLDLASLTSARHTHKTRAVVATAAVLGVTALDVMCAQQLSEDGGKHSSRRRKIVSSITVNRPPDEVYRFWTDLERLPSFMKHLESVQRTGPQTSHWKAKGPFGTTVEWDAEIVYDEPNRTIAWRSLEGSDIHNAGRVTFKEAPNGRGTIVTVELSFEPPGGPLTAHVAKLLRAVPKLQIHDDLRAFKQIMEVGEIVHSDASIFPGMHPAQPPERIPAQVH